MKITWSLVCFLFLFAWVKAQKAKIKNTEVVGHGEGGNPAVKAKVLKNTTQAFPKPLNTARRAAKTRAATESKAVLKPMDNP